MHLDRPKIGHYALTARDTRRAMLATD